MNPMIMAKTAYAAPGGPTRTARDTEYEIFARITHKLKAASDLGVSGFIPLASAMHENRRLWVTLAADVADSGNGLPAALRAHIFSLAEFTGRHTSKVLAGQAGPEALIEINTAIMRGLKREGAEPERKIA